MIRLVCISLVSFRLFLHSSRIRILSKNLFCHSNDRASYSHYHILSSGNDIRLIITFMLARSFFFSSSLFRCRFRCIHFFSILVQLIFCLHFALVEGPSIDCKLQYIYDTLTHQNLMLIAESSSLFLFSS